MKQLLDLVESLLSDENHQSGKSPVKHLGFLSCGNHVHIRHVPFYQPCVIMVLAGAKIIYDGSTPITCETGNLLSVPAPASYDLRNQPNPQRQYYRALVIPFQYSQLAQVQKMHQIEHTAHQDQIKVLKYERDEILTTTIRHYLDCPDDEKLLSHRLSEILLLLIKKKPQLLSYTLAQESWGQRVRTLLSSNLQREWAIKDACGHLATSETTLRRKLRQEDTSFRELLYELRLTSGLMQLLQTSLPVYQIAHECGYQSVSRFTSNFRKRFGLAPTEFRASADAKEQILADSEHYQR